MSVVDMDRIFEISVNKIEHSKSRKVYGKSTMLHRTLLVNTVLNRVRNSDHRPHNTTNNNNKNESSFTNYREPKRIYDMDDYESDKSLTYMECQTRCKAKHNNITTPQKKKNSSLVSLLNSRAMGGVKSDELTRIIRKTDESEPEKENQETVQINTRHEKRRFVSTSSDVNDETSCPTKKLRCIWPANVSDVNSITGLASLFGDLVASSDPEKSSMSLNSNFATAMVAC